MNKNKKIIIAILSILVLILGVIVVFLLIPKDKSKNDKKTNEKVIKIEKLENVNDILDEKNLYDDIFYISYSTEGYTESSYKYYKVNAKYPNVLYKNYSLSKFGAYYSYKDSINSLSLTYKTYDDEEKLKKDFFYNDDFNEESNYYISIKDVETKVYLKTEYGFYIAITIYTGKDFKKINYDNVKNLVDNISIKEIDQNKLSINMKDGYYVGKLEYSDLRSPDYKYTYISANYKVDSKKFNTHASKVDDSFKPERNYEHLSFTQGRVTPDYRSLYELSTISISIGLNKNMNEESLDKEINSCKKSKLNCQNIMADAWLNAKEDDIGLEKGTFKHLGYDVYYFTATYNDKEKDVKATTLFAYIKINDYYTYKISYYGGDYKEINVDSIKPFLPTKIELIEK